MVYLVDKDNKIVFSSANMDGYFVSTEKNKLNLDFIHHYLSTISYWAKGRSTQAVQKSIDHSVCIGVFNKDHEPVGFARVLTDYSVLFYLMDVYIIEVHRNKGLSKMLQLEIMEHRDLQGLQRYILATHDAQSLYEKI